MASETTPPPRVLRFATFEADMQGGEIRKNGLKLKLHGQPFEVLAMLLTHPGELVSRKDLRERLWPTDTFVDFDHGVNTAINRLREALGDSADNPRFVETIPRRGYRFIAPVECSAAMQTAQTAIREVKTVSSVATPGPTANNLPVAAGAFVGRNKEMALVKELLRRQDVRLVTITGPGGIGKSRLALEVAREMAEDFSGGVNFVPLATVSDPGLVIYEIAQSLGVREVAGRSLLEMLKQSLRALPSAGVLVLIDNFEHLLAAAPLLAELLTFAPNLNLLVTSRAALHVYNEHEVSVPPQSLPDSSSIPPLSMLSQFSAISLFVQRAATVKPDFELTEGNAAAVVEICSRLDGLPLAIELAAARAKLLSPTAMCARLASCLQLSAGRARDLPARQQTLQRAIDWSYDLLSSEEQKLFRRVSVFQGGCTLEAAEAVCNAKEDLGLDVLDGMATLVDQNLMRQVEQRSGEPRFTMLETIREYGLEKLTACEEGPTTRRAHAAYCLVLAEEGNVRDSSANLTGWLDRLEIEHDNIRKALEWATENGNSEWGLRLGVALFRFWQMREHLAEGRERLGKLLSTAGNSGAGSLRIRALFAAGVLATEQGDYLIGDALFGESLAIARHLDDQCSVAVALNALAVSALDRGDLVSSRPF